MEGNSFKKGSLNKKIASLNSNRPYLLQDPSLEFTSSFPTPERRLQENLPISSPLPSGFHTLLLPVPFLMPTAHSAFPFSHHRKLQWPAGLRSPMTSLVRQAKRGAWESEDHKEQREKAQRASYWRPWREMTCRCAQGKALSSWAWLLRHA